MISKLDTLMLLCFHGLLLPMGSTYWFDWYRVSIEQKNDTKGKRYDLGNWSLLMKFENVLHIGDKFLLENFHVRILNNFINKYEVFFSSFSRV